MSIHCRKIVLVIRQYLTDKQLRKIYQVFDRYLHIIYMPDLNVKYIEKISNMQVILITCMLAVDEARLYRNLVYVQIYGRGTDKICIEYLNRRDIPYNNCSSEGIDIAIGEYVLLQILLWERDMIQLWDLGRTGSWNWELRNRISYRNLSDIKVGVVGYGYIGSGVFSFLEKFEIKCYVINAGKRMLQNDMEQISQMDYISLHLPLNMHTKKCIDDEFLHYMNKNAILINTSRGGIVDEIALNRAVKYNNIRGASIDVTTVEPFHSEIQDNERILITPHVASRTEFVLDNYIDEIVRCIMPYVGLLE